MGGKLPQSQEVSMMRGGGAMLCLGGKISDLPDSKRVTGQRVFQS